MRPRGQARLPALRAEFALDGGSHLCGPPPMRAGGPGLAGGEEAEFMEMLAKLNLTNAVRA